MKNIFSPTEKDILRILGTKKMTITQLTAKFYDVKLDEPFGANNLIAAVVRRINAKCAYHKLPWILKSVGTGRKGKTVWKSKVLLNK